MREMVSESVETLSDDQLLALCELSFDATQQDELSALLALQREGRLTDAEDGRLDQLMTIYRHGLVLKGRALKEAVIRGLLPGLGGQDFYSTGLYE